MVLETGESFFLHRMDKVIAPSLHNHGCHYAKEVMFRNSSNAPRRMFRILDILKEDLDYIRVTTEGAIQMHSGTMARLCSENRSTSPRCIFRDIRNMK